MSKILVFHLTTAFTGCLQSRYLEPGQTFTIYFFSKILNSFKLLTIFAKKATSQMLDWVENKLLAKSLK